MKHWNCHDHRDELMVSDHCTVYHPEHGQLSQVEKHWNMTLFHPIRFKEKSAAYAWVREGFIADLQTGLCNLGVGFSKESCVENEPPIWQRTAEDIHDAIDSEATRYVALEAALRDDVYADQFPFVGQYRARLLALIDDKETT